MCTGLYVTRGLFDVDPVVCGLLLSLLRSQDTRRAGLRNVCSPRQFWSGHGEEFTGEEFSLFGNPSEVTRHQSRNVSLPGAVPYGTPQSLPERFTRHNFTISKAQTLREIREKHISQSEVER